MVSAGLVMAIDRLAEAVWGVGTLASVAVTVNAVTTPGPVGVPEIAPVLALRLRPLGSDPEVTDHEIGAVPPVEASVAPG